VGLNFAGIMQKRPLFDADKREPSDEIRLAGSFRSPSGRRDAVFLVSDQTALSLVAAIVTITNLLVGVLLLAATLPIGTSTFPSGK
jgi:hypothetical protein